MTAEGFPPVRVLVVDDHPLFRQGIVAAFSNRPQFRVVGEAGDGLEAVEKAKALNPDVVLMDIQMPLCSGLEATLRLSLEVPQAKVLIMTISEKDEDLFQAMSFGARGYLLKETGPQELLRAVAQVAEGGVVFSPIMAAKLLEEFAGEERPPLPTEIEAELTPRETEVLRLVAGGASNRDIANNLFISENTVRTHLKNILDKLHLKNRSQAAVYAARLGIVR